MRQVAVEVAATGLGCSDRLVEIACLELGRDGLTGVHFHTYLNPCRPVSDDATLITGLTQDFLKQWPTFAEAAPQLSSFVAGCRLIVHGRDFVFDLVNCELAPLGLPGLPATHAVHTIALARKLFPGEPANLDALCCCFGLAVDANESRRALVAARLTAEVYRHLIGQPSP